MSSETYKVFTIHYAELRNLGLDNKSDITDYEYSWANLSEPDGLKPDADDFRPVNRRDKVLKIGDYPELCDY